jgi:hypothetical protein
MGLKQIHLNLHSKLLTAAYLPTRDRIGNIGPQEQYVT